MGVERPAKRGLVHAWSTERGSWVVPIIYVVVPLSFVVSIWVRWQGLPRVVLLMSCGGWSGFRE